MAERHRNYREHALSLVRARGIVRARDFKAAGIPLVYLKRLTDSGDLTRLGRGLYQDPERSGEDVAHDLAEAASLVPHGIISLISAMDDAIDQMQQTAKTVRLFEVKEFDQPMQEMGAIIQHCAELVVRALPLLQSIGPNVATLSSITEELTRLEGKVDDLHDLGLKKLFLKHRNGNTMDYIVGAEIYDHLEKVADRFDDVANEINSIVIEQV